MADLKAILQSAHEAIQRSKKAHTASTTLLENLKGAYQKSVKANQTVQERLNRQILTITQRLDEATLRFLKVLE